MSPKTFAEAVMTLKITQETGCIFCPKLRLGEMSDPKFGFWSVDYDHDVFAVADGVWSGGVIPQMPVVNPGWLKVVHSQSHSQFNSHLIEINSIIPETFPIKTDSPFPTHQFHDSCQN